MVSKFFILNYNPKFSPTKTLTPFTQTQSQSTAPSTNSIMHASLLLSQKEQRKAREASALPDKH
jgi:hypothetical protein